jgi:hypothetical protein
MAYRMVSARLTHEGQHATKVDLGQSDVEDSLQLPGHTTGPSDVAVNIGWRVF